MRVFCVRHIIFLTDYYLVKRRPANCGVHDYADCSGDRWLYPFKVLVCYSAHCSRVTSFLRKRNQIAPQDSAAGTITLDICVF